MTSYRRSNDGSGLEIEDSTAGASGGRDHGLPAFDPRKDVDLMTVYRQVKAAAEDDPFDCTECPDDPRPHLHCPWGGFHKHYKEDEVQD